MSCTLGLSHLRTIQCSSKRLSSVDWKGARGLSPSASRYADSGVNLNFIGAMKKKTAVSDVAVMDMKAPNPQTECVLFKLPPELRIDIYTLVFAVNLNDFGRVPLSHTSRHEVKKPTVLTVLQTCRLIRDEAEDLFYNQHHFEINNIHFWLSGIDDFVKSLNVHRLAAIRTVTLLVGYAECVTTFIRSIAKNLTGLSSVTLLMGETEGYPHDTYQTRRLKRELPILKRALKYLPMSLLHFKIRFGYVRRDDGVYYFDGESVTEGTEKVEAMVMALIARRKDADGVVSNLNGFEARGKIKS